MTEYSPCCIQPVRKQHLQPPSVKWSTHPSWVPELIQNHSVVDDPTVVEVAKKLNKDPAILLISWAVQRGSSVLPKSVTASRIESNFQGEFPSSTRLYLALS